MAVRSIATRRRGLVGTLMERPMLFAGAFLSIFCAIAFALSMADPACEAHAAPGIVQIVGSIFGANEIVDSFISGMLRGAINSCLSLASTILSSSADTSALTKGFGEVWPTLAPVVRTIHETIAVPIANVVLATFLVVGIVKYMQRLGQADAAADSWTLIMVFVLYALVKSCIDASFPLMLMCFDMCRGAIEAVIDLGGPGGVAVAYAAVPDDVNGAGWLFLALLVSIIVVVISWAASMVTQLVIIVRMIQLYVYTALAAIPLSAIISDSGRSIATGFMKKYLALLLTGVIIAILVVMYSVVITSVGTTADLASGGDADAIEYLWQLLGSTVTSLAMIFCMVKCSSWARDLIGC